LPQANIDHFRYSLPQKPSPPAFVVPLNLPFCSGQGRRFCHEALKASWNELSHSLVGASTLTYRNANTRREPYSGWIYRIGRSILRWAKQYKTKQKIAFLQQADCLGAC